MLVSRRLPVRGWQLVDDGPVDRASVSDTYRGRELPTSVAMFTHDTLPLMTCPNTGKRVNQADNDQLFLVPTDDCRFRKRVPG